jgi:hypothetical protein
MIRVEASIKHLTSGWNVGRNVCARVWGDEMTPVCTYSRRQSRLPELPRHWDTGTVTLEIREKFDKRVSTIKTTCKKCTSIYFSTRLYSFKIQSSILQRTERNIWVRIVFPRAHTTTHCLHLCRLHLIGLIHKTLVYMLTENCKICKFTEIRITKCVIMVQILPSTIISLRFYGPIFQRKANASLVET